MIPECTICAHDIQRIFQKSVNQFVGDHPGDGFLAPEAAEHMVSIKHHFHIIFPRQNATREPNFEKYEIPSHSNVHSLSLLIVTFIERQLKCILSCST